MIDYYKLLRKYIQHVGQAEGVTHICNIGQPYASDVAFSDAEATELRRIEDEIIAEAQ